MTVPDANDILREQGPDELRRRMYEAPVDTHKSLVACPPPRDEMPPDKCSGIDNLIDDAEIARLASLSPIECDRQIKAAAERMGCKQSTLNAAVKAARGNAHNADAQGRAIELPTREPWHTAIDGADLLRDLVTAIRRHVVVGEAAASAVALWVLVSYAANAFFIFPLLLINSPEKRCGKSTLLDVIECLVQKPLKHATPRPRRSSA